MKAMRTDSRLVPLLMMVALLVLPLGAFDSAAPAAPAAQSLPTRDLLAIDAGWNASCAVTGLGAARCWGAGIYGQLGNGTSLDVYHPAQVTGLEGRVVEVSAGSDFACARLRPGAEAGGYQVQCWGANWVGTLGDGATEASSSPLTVSNLTGTVSNISAGLSHVCAAVEGAVKCWGSNWNGELGNGAVGKPVTVPTEVPLPVRKVVAGYHHTCALLLSGGVRCWGDGSTGQVGDGRNQAANPTPVEVEGLGSGVVDIAAGGAHSCAVLQDGRVACWGANWWGQLGDGSTTPRSTPVFAAIREVVSISAGGSHTCAVTSSGAAYCWGDNAGGQLGDGTGTDRPLPTLAVGLESGVRAVSAGSAHSCALLQSGGAMCWGANRGGLLGVGSSEPNVLVPMSLLEAPTSGLPEGNPISNSGG